MDGTKKSHARDKEEGAGNGKNGYFSICGWNKEWQQQICQT